MARFDETKTNCGWGRRIPAWRAWLFRLCLVVLSPIVFCMLLEVGLRLWGYGYPTRFFLEHDASGACETNYRFGWRFFPRALAKGPEPYILPTKPAGAVRIFVLGSSAAMGTPDPAFNFGRILAVMLRQHYPDVRFEIVNAAITAINSHVAREIARDCAAHEPDLFVIYMGNNEVIGPYGPGTVFQKWSPSLGMIRASIWAKSMRVGQLLVDIASAFRRDKDAPGHWRGMQMFLNNPVAADDPRLPVVYENYRRNLDDICDIARGVGAGVVLSTVAVNLRDSPPFASQHRSNLTGDDLARWESAYKAGVALEASNRWQEAIEQYDAASKVDDRFAELQFRLGQNLVKTGRFAEALKRLGLARDLDVLRFRADARINSMIREVGAAQKTEGVRLVDAERILAEGDQDSHGIPGEELFYEHVHFTFDGNYLLARAVFNDVCESLPQLVGVQRHGDIPSRQLCAELLALTPYEEYKLVDAMLDMTAKQPFTNQFDHKIRQAAAQRRRDHLYQVASTPEALRTALRTYEAALAKAPEDCSLHSLIGRWALQHGLQKSALAHLQIALRGRPGDVMTQCDYGSALASLGRGDEAVAEYQKALKLQPDMASAYNNLGLALAGLGKLDAAMVNYRMAIGIAPDGMEAHFNLALALVETGKLSEAVTEFQKMLEIKPEDANAHFKLAVTLAQAGNVSEAIVHFTEAVRLKPDLVLALNNLAWIRATHDDAKLRDGAEAVRLAEHACQLTDRKQAPLLDTLAVAYAEAGRFQQAVAVAEEAIALAKAAKQQALVDEIQSRLGLYRAGKPYREQEKTLDQEDIQKPTLNPNRGSNPHSLPDPCPI